tara:strand:- start:27 stop:440 length:414 start_codon:yes stop_codon:yes gene_type:complete
MARFSRKISSWLGKDDVMNGVIIWSEHVSKRAIIWCEDHGRLAFFKAEETLQGELSRKNQVFAYESGDMVSFTVDEQADLRRACDLQWVSRQKYPHLAEQLKAGSSSVAAVARPSGNIVQFRCVEPTDPGAEAYEVA